MVQAFDWIFFVVCSRKPFCIDAIDSFHCTFGHTRDLHVQSGQKWPLFLSISLSKYDCYSSFFKYDYIIIRDKFPNIYDSLSHVISFSVLFHFRAKVHFNFFKCKYLHDLKQNFRDLAQLNFFELTFFNTRKFHEQKSIPRRFTPQSNSKGLFLSNVELKT